MNDSTEEKTSAFEVIPQEFVTETVSLIVEENEKQSAMETTKQEVVAEKVTDNTSLYKPNGKTPQAMIDVFLGEKEFVYVEEDCLNGERIKDESMKMSQLNYYDEDKDELLEYGPYKVIDLDGDGYNEMVIDTPSKEALVLHYEDNKVYGYMYPWRGIKVIYESGLFQGSSGANDTSFSRIEFDETSFNVIEVVSLDEGVYCIDGKEVTGDEYMKYINSDKFAGEVPYWYDYESILTTK